MSITLCCLVKGNTTAHAFPIHIKRNKLVGDLKDAIKAKMQNDFAGVDANKLKLWKVEILDDRDDPYDPLSNLTLQDQPELCATREIEEYWSNKPPNRKFIHVVVEPPLEAPKKRVKIDGELNKCWQALKNASCENELLSLSENTRFLGKKFGPHSLFIRKCYRDLQNVVFDDAINKLRITGNPGIGKTFFGYYLLYLLALQNATIVYDNFDEGSPIVFMGGKNAFTSSKEGIRPYIRDPSVWYIVDNQESKSVNAKTILLCSKRDHYKRFDKYHDGVVTMRFMPVWNWSEISLCWKKLYKKEVGWPLAKDLFSKWGGIPRFVLERANKETHQEKLNDAIKSCQGDIFDCFGESCIERTPISHMIVHIYVNLPVEDDDELDKDELSRYQGSQLQLDRNGKIPYTKTVIRFASNYVWEEVTKHLDTCIRKKLEETKAGMGNSLLSSSFEYVAHRILRNGGNFDVRPLDEYSDDDNNDPDAKVNLRQQNVPLYFSKATIDKIKDGMYYQPWVKNFPSIDSIIAPNKVFQMTIAKVHPIRMSGLKSLYDKFGDKTATDLIYYYFVVPEHLYDDYKVQKFINSDDKDATIIQNWIKERVFQYVLKIKL